MNLTISTFALLVVATLPLSCARRETAEQQGNTASSARVRTLDQSNFDAEVQNGVVLVDFWATWCGPCKVEIPWFVEFQQKYAAKGLQVIGVSVDDTVDKLKPYVAQFKMNYPVLQGLNHDDVQDAYGPMWGIPVTAVISRDGKICAKHTGLSSKPAFENEIKSLL